MIYYVYINNYQYISNQFSVKVLYMSVVAIEAATVMVVTFGGGPITFQGFVEINILDIQDEAIHSSTGTWIELFCWCQVLPQHFLSIAFIYMHMSFNCIIFPSFSFDVHCGLMPNDMPC